MEMGCWLHSANYLSPLDAAQTQISHPFYGFKGSSSYNHTRSYRVHRFTVGCNCVAIGVNGMKVKRVSWGGTTNSITTTLLRDYYPHTIPAQYDKDRAKGAWTEKGPWLGNPRSHGSLQLLALCDCGESFRTLSLSVGNFTHLLTSCLMLANGGGSCYPSTIGTNSLYISNCQNKKKR